ncbi:flagellar hook-length control protein FliK [Lachnospiraceae bacterium ZAX-1]
MPFIERISQYQNSNLQGGQTVATIKGTPQTLTASLSELTAGKIFEGTITAVKNDQVTIGLSNGQSITARMENGVNLKSGAPMLFEIKSNDGTQVLIRPVSVDGAQNATLSNALEAAGIKPNERNLAMVSEMVKEQMPIDKNSLLNMLKLSLNYSKVDVATLVQMSKLNLKVDSASIGQFENYRANQHMLLDQFRNFMDEMPNVMKNSGATPQEMLVFWRQLFNIFDSPMGAGRQQQGILPDSFGTVGGVGTGELGQLADARLHLGSAQIDTNLDQTMQNQGQPDAGVGTGMQNQGQPDAGADTGMQNQGQLEADIGQTIQNQVTANPLTNDADFNQRIGQAAQEDLNVQQLEKNTEKGVSVADILTKSQQAELVAQLKEFPGMEENPVIFRDGQLNTAASSAELLNAIQQALQESKGFSSASLQKLFYGDEYQGLMKHVIETQWLVMPDELASENKIKELYERINRQMESLDILLQNTGKGDSVLSKTVQNVRSNLDFMNQINQMYNYVQIPLKLKNQNAHSDLYVYTNKKNLRDKEGELTALLHLDMDNLGSTDIYLTMRGTDVTATFKMDDKSAVRLIIDHSGELAKRLQAKGYTCKINVENQTKTKTKDFVDDFMKQEQPGGKVHKYSYSFDVKA